MGKKTAILFSLQCSLQSRENRVGGPISVIWLWSVVRFKHLLLCFMLSVLHILRMYWGNKRIVSLYSQNKLYARWCMWVSEDMKSLFVPVNPWTTATLSTLFHHRRIHPSGLVEADLRPWLSKFLCGSQRVTVLCVPNWPQMHCQYTSGF